jgi:hypothetical protein
LGGAKQMMLEDTGFDAFLQDLINGGHLEGPALGITKKVIADGEESLSPKQQHVFKNYVLAEYVTNECKRCGEDIPWSEMYHAYDNGHLCNWCWHMTTKDD